MYGFQLTPSSARLVEAMRDCRLSIIALILALNGLAMLEKPTCRYRFRPLLN